MMTSDFKELRYIFTSVRQTHFTGYVEIFNVAVYVHALYVLISATNVYFVENNDFKY